MIMNTSDYSYFVYIVRCADDTLYTGITTDVDRRVIEHNEDSMVGAKYTRSRRPVCLVYKNHFPDRAAASREEHRIKQLSRLAKENLIQ